MVRDKNGMGVQETQLAVASACAVQRYLKRIVHVPAVSPVNIRSEGLGVNRYTALVRKKSSGKRMRKKERVVADR